MIIILISGDISRTFSISSSPFRPGILISVIKISVFSLRISSSAWIPFAAVPTTLIPSSSQLPSATISLHTRSSSSATTSLTISTSFYHTLNNAGIYFRRHLTNILIFLELPDIRCRADDMVAHPLRSQEIFLLVD